MEGEIDASEQENGTFLPALDSKGLKKSKLLQKLKKFEGTHA